MTSLLKAVSDGYAIPSGLVVNGRTQPPPSKSITQRVLNLALLARQASVVESPLLSEDTGLFMAALESLGYQCKKEEGSISLEPGEPVTRARIWCGNNGTMLRFLTAALSTVPGEWVLEGTERLQQRPIGPLVEALRVLGGRLEFEDREGFAPVSISGGPLKGGSVDLDASLSSQFVSALLMAATQAENEVVVRVKDLVSGPYLQLTRQVMSSFGATTTYDVETSLLRAQPVRLKGGIFEVEGDFSSAAYPAAAAILTGGRVQVMGLGQESHQGDRRFLNVLSEMGADVRWHDRSFEVRASEKLEGIDVDLADMPDQVPTLAILAPFAKGKTTIRNVQHLRIKESDRLAAMVQELGRLGASIRETVDGLEVEGSWADRRRVPKTDVQVKTYGDHRVAMSLAVCGLVRPGVIIDAPDVVAKSYPLFWDDLESLLVK